MAMDGLYISGYFSDDDKLMLDNYADELHSKNVGFYLVYLITLEYETSI